MLTLLHLIICDRIFFDLYTIQIFVLYYYTSQILYYKANIIKYFLTYILLTIKPTVWTDKKILKCEYAVKWQKMPLTDDKQQIIKY